MPAPAVTCCAPERALFPSGYTWAHAADCRVNPKQKIALAQANAFDEMRRVGAQKAETARAGISVYELRGKTWAELIDGSPQPAAQQVAMWHTHPIDCDCLEACHYVNAHLDDWAD